MFLRSARVRFPDRADEQAGPGSQDPGKRVGIEHPSMLPRIDFRCWRISSVKQQVSEHDLSGGSSSNSNGLRRERGTCIYGRSRVHTRCVFVASAVSVRVPAVRIPTGPP